MENIQVALRVRPLNKKELARYDDNIWEIPNPDTIALSSSNSREYFASKKINCTGRTSFYFDQCFSPEQDNIKVYNQVAKRVVLSSLNGINGTIFMYGQTGSGKTYTMMGFNKNEEEDHETSVHSRGASPFNRSLTPPTKQMSRKSFTSAAELYESGDQSNHGNYIITDVTESTGILVMALRDIFDTIEKDMDKTFFLRCSYVEIYNDQIYDLLKPAERMTEVLSVNEDGNKEFYIKGLIEESVSSIEEILGKLKKGEANRHYARTTMNHTSSRSHTIFRLMVQSVTNSHIREYRRENSKYSTNINNMELRSKLGDIAQHTSNDSQTEGTMVTESLLNFVDLAGSEKVSNHQMLMEDPAFLNVDQGGIYGRDSMMAATKLKERVKEGQHINKSLFFLTQVISLKSEGKSNQHIPYRNSPLTKILRSSLGGNSRTLIILCLTPAASQFEQTMSTLRFGMNAKKIENKVQANIITRDDDVGLKILISDYEKKLKDSELARQEEQTKYANLLRQVEELQLHKSALIERLGSLCKSRITKMAESIPEEDLLSFYKQAKEHYVYFNKVGVLFSSKDLKKYDYMFENTNTAAADVTGSERKSRTRRRKVSQAQESELGLDDEKVVSQVRKNVSEQQSKMEESLCKFYSKLYKAHKEQNNILSKKLSTLEKNMQAICERNVENYNNYLNCYEKSQTRSKQLREVAEEFQREMERSVQLQTTVDLYKDLNGLSELDDNEVSNLEKHFWEKLDKIKMERAKRMILKDMSLGKDLSECNKECVETQQKQKIDLSVYLNFDENDCIENDQKAEKQGKEELAIREILQEGLEDIDRELERSKKSLLETKEVFCPVEEEDTRRIGRSLRTDRGEKARRESSVGSSPAKTPVKSGYTSIRGASSSKKKSPVKTPVAEKIDNIPKLDLGLSLNNVTIDPNLPKLVLPTPTQQLNRPVDISPKSGSTELSSIRGSEIPKTCEISLDASNIQENNNIHLPVKSLKKEEKFLNPSLTELQDDHKILSSRRNSNFAVYSQIQSDRPEEVKEKERPKPPLAYTTDKRLDQHHHSMSMSSTQSPSQPDHELANLQNRLSKHLNSLEKYLAKPSSAGFRRSRSSRSEVVSFTQTHPAPKPKETFATPTKNSGGLKEESGAKGRNIEGEFEYQEDSEGEYKMKSVSKKEGDKEKGQKVVKKIDDSCFPEMGNGELNLTNIEKEETIFSTSIFSIKDFDGFNKEKDFEHIMENNVLKQLDNILGKSDHDFDFENCLSQVVNDSKKRRKRAERLKKGENDS